MRNVIPSLALIVVLSACAVGPDYKRPVIDTPQVWRLEEAQAGGVADTVWWEQFKDPILNDLINVALKDNKDIRIAAARVEEFIGRYGIAGSSLYPQVDAGASGTRTRSSDLVDSPLPSYTKNPYSDYLTSFNASWEIDIWGRLRRTTEAALAELLSTKEARHSVIMTLVCSVASSYMSLRRLDRQLEIAQRTAKSREESFGLFTLRFERGLISELELKQVESEYRQALAAIPSLQKQTAQQENALSILLGRNPGPIIRGKQLDEMVLPAVPAGLPSQLLERRPDIRQAEEDLASANALIGAAKALYFPTVSLTGSYGVESMELARLFTGPAKTWSYGASFVLPIFNAGKIAGQVKAAEAVQQQRFLRYQQAVQNAFREVDDALIDQNKTREQLDIQKQQVEALRGYAGLAKLRYENGYTSYLEVLDAERSLFNAELNYTQTKGDLFNALVNLYKSMGGGWIAEAEKLTAR